MKKSCEEILWLLAVLMLIGMPVTAMANTIVLNADPNYSYGGGGEFNAVTTGQDFLGNGYISSTIVNGGFETFCIQTEVDCGPGVNYNYTEASATGANAIQGGITLSEGAAYLYYEFATGNLTGYNYTPGSGRATTASELQAALWYFMGEAMPDGFTTTDDPFVSLADKALSDPFGANGTSYGVEILQLTTTDSDAIAIQNQLALTGGGIQIPNAQPQPTPDGGMTAAMLGMSLVGMFLIRFQSRKSIGSQI
jgi:hypothetical protein